jgi:hypothetical protein
MLWSSCVCGVSVRFNLAFAEQEVFTLVDLHAGAVSITRQLLQAHAAHAGMSVREA